jgi:hypothetical protein
VGLKLNGTYGLMAYVHVLLLGDTIDATNQNI